MRRITSVFLIALFLLLVTKTSQQVVESLEASAIQQKIKWLYDRLMKKYWKKDQQYVFPIKWQHKKGLFQSRVHFNIVDKRNTALTQFIRDDYFKIDDINMFVTSFILYGLIQAKQLGTVKLDEHIMSESIMSISSFKDKNIPDGIPQYAFWPQVKINGTWTARATNLVHSVNLLPQPPKFMQNFLIKIGLAILTQLRNLSKAFCIPADNDDSSVNLALLGLLKQSKSTHFQFWNSLIPKKQEYYERALKYAYRPFTANFSINKHADEIDPRTYFVLRQFLDMKQKQSQNPSLILPTTWLINTDQQVDDLVLMPFKSNNVDASVTANFLFGLSYQLIIGQVKLNQQLTQMIINSVDLLQFTVKNILSKRQTLILVYYPSRYDFYWFISRLVGLLKRHNVSYPLSQVKERLQKLMKQVASKQIFQSAIKNSNGFHWREFLGNYANKQREQDAIFSSSLALNALFDTWTTRNGSNLSYDSDVPDQVKKTIQQGIKYLMSELNPKMKQLNAFFSGSMKLFSNTFPYFFPSNLALDGKNQTIDPTNLTLKNLTFSSRVYVKGYIQPKKYEQMLTKKWFGSQVPQKQVDLNSQRGLTFPFWSSRAITQVMAISSLSKYLKVNLKEKPIGKNQYKIEKQYKKDSNI